MSYKILFIGAHNDENIGTTGGLSKILADRGNECYFLSCVGLWHCDTATEEQKKLWETQEQKAAEMVGAKLTVLGPRDTALYRSDPDSIAAIEKYVCEVQPDIIFIHWPQDNHLEHRMVAKDSYNAICAAFVHGAHYKEAYCFEAGANQTANYFIPDFIIDITPEMPSLQESFMQFDQPTAKGAGIYKDKCAVSQLRGFPSSLKYAEGYKLLKLPSGNNDFLLKQLVNDRFHWCGNGMYPAFGKYYF